MSEKNTPEVFYKSNYAHKIPLQKFTAAEKEQVLRENAAKQRSIEEKKEGERAVNLARELRARDSVRKIVSSFKPRRNGRSKSVQPTKRNNNLTRTKKHRSADDLMKNRVANDISRDQRAKRKIRNKSVSILDRLEKMPLDVQNEIYSWIQDPPKTPHLSKPKINRSEVTQYPDQVLLEELMRTNVDLLDSLIYQRAMDVEVASSTYHTRMFEDNDQDLLERDADDDETLIILHKNKLFSTTFEEFKDKTRIEYNVTGDFIRFRVVPKYMKKIGSRYELDYDGLIVVDRYEFDEDTEDEDDAQDMFLNYSNPGDIPRFSDRTRYIMKKYFRELEYRHVYQHKRIVLGNGQKYSMIHLDW